MNWKTQLWLDASLEQAGNILNFLSHWAKFLGLRLLLLTLSPALKLYHICGWLHKPVDKLLAAFAKAEMVSLLKLPLEKC